ncbi:dienelactone hydrolase family protein, partial [Bacillus sp. JJ1764]
MIQFKNRSDTVIILIHEIYGINQHMQSYCELLSKQGFDVI